MSLFICPVCKSELLRNESTYSCRNGHSFDISKEGYVNLLMSQKSSLKHHGDDKLMVASRRDFLEKGYYEPLAELICDELENHLKRGGAICDVGCGEGYYTAFVAERFENSEIACIDISKFALKYAARRKCRFSLAVAGAFDLPLADESVDCVLNVFAPCAYGEFSRVLKNDGILLKAVPLEDHLFELKKALYDEPYKNKPEKQDHKLFEIISQKELKYNITLENNAVIEMLFKMTPYYYKTGSSDAEKLLSLDKLDVTAHFNVEVLRKRCNVTSR